MPTVVHLAQYKGCNAILRYAYSLCPAGVHKRVWELIHTHIFAKYKALYEKVPESHHLKYFITINLILSFSHKFKWGEGAGDRDKETSSDLIWALLYIFYTTD